MTIIIPIIQHFGEELPCLSWPIWQKVWGILQLGKRSQSLNLPQPGHDHDHDGDDNDDKHNFYAFSRESPNLLKILLPPWSSPCCWFWCSEPLREQGLKEEEEDIDDAVDDGVGVDARDDVDT